MNVNAKLSWAIASILGGHSAALAIGATRSAASPAAIEVIPRDCGYRTAPSRKYAGSSRYNPGTYRGYHQRAHVATFDDFVNYLPNVMKASFGPGQSSIYMRGLSIGSVGAIQASGLPGQMPNVAVYLDEQSKSLPGSDLDLYTADIELSEVLEEFHRVLFGSGAEAGVQRGVITNMPKLDQTGGPVNAGYSFTMAAITAEADRYNSGSAFLVGDSDAQVIAYQRYRRDDCRQSGSGLIERDPVVERLTKNVLSRFTRSRATRSDP